MTNNLTMQELLEQQEQEFNQVKAGQTITGKISKISNDEVVVELNYGFDGVIKNEELNLPKMEEQIEIANTQTLFIPISQLDTKFVEKTENYVGKNLEVYIKELDAKKNRIVATHREVLQERLDKEREERDSLEIKDEGISRSRF